jgi:tetratricopeptide (TPR) repeat protein
MSRLSFVITSILIGILFLSHLVLCQTSSDFIKNGFTKYESGDYNAALQNFDGAIQYAETEKNVPLAETHEIQHVKTNQQTNVTPENKNLMETSDMKYGKVSEPKEMETETMKYFSEPMTYEGDDLCVTYLYRGRTNIQLGDKEKALNDFDKALKLNSALSEQYFKKTLETHQVHKETACPYLLNAIKNGHPSAQMLYDLICNEN